MNEIIRRAFFNALILLGLLALITAPRVFTGWQDLRRAQRALSDDCFAEAASAYESAAQRLPWEAGLWQQAGQAALSSGNPKKALDLLQEASEKGDLSQGGRLALGDAYWRVGDSNSAVGVWEHMRSEGFVSAGLYARLGRAYEVVFHDLPRAIQNRRELITLEPNNAQALYRLGLLLVAENSPDALPELMRAAQMDPALDGNVQVMRTALNTAFLQDDSAYNFLIAGRALAAIGEWQLAEMTFTNAVDSNRNYADAWAWLGEARQHLALEGSVEIQKAVTLDPNSAMIQALNGLYWQRLGQSRQALEAFQKAVEIEPENAGWQVALGDAYAQSGDLVSALAFYQRAVEMTPKDATYWRALAVFSVQYDVQLKEIGLPAAMWALALAPGDWQALDVMGQAAQASGDLEGAETFFLRALVAGPGQAAPHLHLGWLYLQKGDTARAYDQLVQALDISGSGPLAEQSRRLLKQYFP